MIDGDPRISHRPAEGIRIAAGLQPWKRTEIVVLLRGPAGYVLQEFHDELVDEDNFTHYLPMLRDAKIPVWVEASFADREAIQDSPWPHQFADLVKMAELVRSARNVITL